MLLDEPGVRPRSSNCRSRPLRPPRRAGPSTGVSSGAARRPGTRGRATGGRSSRGSHIVSYRCSRCVVEHLVGAAQALGDVLAGELDVHAAGPHARRPRRRRRSRGARASRRRSAVSCNRWRAERVPVHRVARPHDGVAGMLDRAQQRRAAPRSMRSAPMRLIEHEPAGLAARVQALAERRRPRRAWPSGRASRRSGCCTPERNSTWAPSRLAGALADPEQVGRAVVPVAGEAVAAGERLLVPEQQRLVRRVEVDLVQLQLGVEVDAARRHEAQRPLDLAGEALVAPALRARRRRTPGSRRAPGAGRRSRPW